jgi:hypothetical protein
VLLSAIGPTWDTREEAFTVFRKALPGGLMMRIKTKVKAGGIVMTGAD